MSAAIAELEKAINSIEKAEDRDRVAAAFKRLRTECDLVPKAKRVENNQQNHLIVIAVFLAVAAMPLFLGERRVMGSLQELEELHSGETPKWQQWAPSFKRGDT